MRLIYFSYEYYCQHGARTHARQFYQALNELDETELTLLFPMQTDSKEIPEAGTSRRPSKPHYLETVGSFVYMLRPKPSLVQQFMDVIRRNKIDTIIIRPTEKFNIIPDIKKLAPDAIVCAEVNAAIFDEQFPGVPFRKALQRHEVNCLNHADVVMTVSNEMQKYLVQRGLDSRKCFVCPNGVDPLLFRRRDDLDVAALRAEFGVPPEAFLVGYVGGMEPFRRLPEVVQQIAELRRTGEKDLFLLLVGDGSDRLAVQKAISENSDALAGWVHCEGWRPHEDIPRIMQSLDLAIFPFSNPYGSPLKIFEYLAMQLPVIGPAVPAATDVFEDEKHLLLVPQQGDGFLQALKLLRYNPEIRDRLARAGREHVTSKFTWKKNAERVLDHIRKFRNTIEN